MNAARNVASLIVGLASLAPSATYGQSSSTATGGGGGQCVAVPADTAAGFVYGSLAPESRDAKVDRARLVSVLSRLSVALLDDTLTLDPVAPLLDVVITAMGQARDPRPMIMPRWPGHPALVSEIALTVDQSGALTDSRVIVRGDSAVAATLLRAIAATPPIGEAAADAPQRLRLRLMLSPDSTAVAMPLVAARQLSVEGTPPRQRPREGGPSWPRLGTRSRQEATVLAWYVVDARGSTVAASFGAAPAADPAFAERYEAFVDAVKKATLGARHEPATVGGCATARRVVLFVRFDTDSR